MADGEYPMSSSSAQNVDNEKRNGRGTLSSDRQRTTVAMTTVVNSWARDPRVAGNRWMRDVVNIMAASMRPSRQRLSGGTFAGWRLADHGCPLPVQQRSERHQELGSRLGVEQSQRQWQVSGVLFPVRALILSVRSSRATLVETTTHVVRTRQHCCCFDHGCLPSVPYNQTYRPEWILPRRGKAAKPISRISKSHVSLTLDEAPRTKWAKFSAGRRKLG